mmetsp:Transcript_745/g.1057  ORF Transcript_745/g.1057 Transcript_745/m.1057 type:complete len:89 (+) Transcript_745:903-1169(+)
MSLSISVSLAQTDGDGKGNAGFGSALQGVGDLAGIISLGMAASTTRGCATRAAEACWRNMAYISKRLKPATPNAQDDDPRTEGVGEAT